MFQGSQDHSACHGKFHFLCIYSVLFESLCAVFHLCVHVCVCVCVCVFTPPRNNRGVVFLRRFVCVFVCVCLCLSICEQNDYDAVFAKQLLLALAQTLLKWMTLVKNQGHNDVMWVGF